MVDLEDQEVWDEVFDVIRAQGFTALICQGYLDSDVGAYQILLLERLLDRVSEGGYWLFYVLAHPVCLKIFSFSAHRLRT